MRLELSHGSTRLSSAPGAAAGASLRARGFGGAHPAVFASGVRNVVVSQWRVDSQSTNTSTASLHLKNLQRKEAPEVALRHAMLALMRSALHDLFYNRAAFVAAGT